MKYDHGGVDNPMIILGVTALKFGFGVTYIGYNPILFFKENIKKELFIFVILTKS